MVDQLKEKTLLAFYNIFSEELGVEDATNLFELRQLLPIVTAYIKNGNLEFFDEKDFGFSSAVDFLRDQGYDEDSYGRLDGAAADDSDNLEIIKILSALMYEFRLAQSTNYKIHCSKLDPSENRVIAEIVKTSALNSTPNYHSMVQVCFTPDIHHQSANHSAYRTPARSVLRLTEVNTGSVIRRPVYTSTPRLSSIVLNFDDNDLSVTNSPRGGESSLKRQISQLKAERDKFGLECDLLYGRCQQQKHTISKLKHYGLSLEGRNRDLRQQVDNFVAMEDQLADFHAAHATLQVELQGARDALIEATATRKALSFNYNEALERCDLLQHELDQVKADYSVAVNSERELAKTVTTLEAELSDVKEQHDTDVNYYRQKLQTAQEQLDHRELCWNHRFNAKNQEFLDLVQLMNSTHTNRGTLARQFGDDLDAKNIQLERLQRDLANLTREYNTLKELQAKCARCNANVVSARRGIYPSSAISPSKITRNTKSIRHQPGTSSANTVNEGARLRELGERNAKMPRLLQSQYLPETAPMKGDVGLEP